MLLTRILTTIIVKHTVLLKQVYKTCSIRAKFNDEETAFWLNQCENANSLINCALYETKKIHYAKLQENGNAFTTYWRGDDLHSGWKTYRCTTTYPELDLILKQNIRLVRKLQSQTVQSFEAKL
jgi:hypothetical protein